MQTDRVTKALMALIVVALIANIAAPMFFPVKIEIAIKEQPDHGIGILPIMICGPGYGSVKVDADISTIGSSLDLDVDVTGDIRAWDY